MWALTHRFVFKVEQHKPTNTHTHMQREWRGGQECRKGARANMFAKTDIISGKCVGSWSPRDPDLSSAGREGFSVGREARGGMEG